MQSSAPPHWGCFPLCLCADEQVHNSYTLWKKMTLYLDITFFIIIFFFLHFNTILIWGLAILNVQSELGWRRITVFIFHIKRHPQPKAPNIIHANSQNISYHLFVTAENTDGQIITYQISGWNSLKQQSLGGSKSPFIGYELEEFMVWEKFFHNTVSSHNHSMCAGQAPFKDTQQTGSL